MFRYPWKLDISALHEKFRLLQSGIQLDFRLGTVFPGMVLMEDETGKQYRIVCVIPKPIPLKSLSKWTLPQVQHFGFVLSNCSSTGDFIQTSWDVSWKRNTAHFDAAKTCKIPPESSRCGITVKASQFDMTHLLHLLQVIQYGPLINGNRKGAMMDLIAWLHYRIVRTVGWRGHVVHHKQEGGVQWGEEKIRCPVISYWGHITFQTAGIIDSGAPFQNLNLHQPQGVWYEGAEDGTPYQTNAQSSPKVTEDEGSEEATSNGNYHGTGENYIDHYYNNQRLALPTGELLPQPQAALATNTAEDNQQPHSCHQPAFGETAHGGGGFDTWGHARATHESTYDNEGEEDDEDIDDWNDDEGQHNEVAPEGWGEGGVGVGGGYPAPSLFHPPFGDPSGFRQLEEQRKKGQKSQAPVIPQHPGTLMQGNFSPHLYVHILHGIAAVRTNLEFFTQNVLQALYHFPAQDNSTKDPSTRDFSIGRKLQYVFSRDKARNNNTSIDDKKDTAISPSSRLTHSDSKAGLESTTSIPSTTTFGQIAPINNGGTTTTTTSTSKATAAPQEGSREYGSGFASREDITTSLRVESPYSNSSSSSNSNKDGKDIKEMHRDTKDELFQKLVHNSQERTPVKIMDYLWHSIDRVYPMGVMVIQSTFVHFLVVRVTPEILFRLEHGYYNEAIHCYRLTPSQCNSLLPAFDFFRPDQSSACMEGLCGNLEQAGEIVQKLGSACDKLVEGIVDNASQ